MKTLFQSISSVKEGFKQLMIMGIEESIIDPEAKGCFVVNSIVELSPADEELSMLFLENQKYVEHIFYQHLKLGVDRGEISKELDLMAVAAFLYNNYSGIKILAKVNKDRSSLYKVIDTTMKILD